MTPAPLPQVDAWAAIWPELIKGVPAAFVALIIGGIAGGIAWRQFRVARAKLNLDLFEHRYALFEIIWTYLSAQGSPSNSLEESFGNSIHKAYFFFGEDIGDFMTECIAKRFELRSAMQTLHVTPHDAPDRTKVEKQCTGLSQYWLDELGGLRKRFAPYMAFSEWR